MKNKLLSLFSSVLGSSPKGPFTLADGFTLTAHTGCEDTPDNSLDSIRVGAKAGADIVEIDLRFDSQGNPFLSHDELKGGEPTLESAFKAVAEYENLKINVDCKTVDNLSVVQELMLSTGLSGRVFYTGIGEKEVEAAKATSLIPYYLNTSLKKSRIKNEKYLKELADKVESLGAMGININFRQSGKELVEFFHKRGLLVSLWTANNENQMLRCLSLSPDNITTRRPTELGEIIKEKCSNKARS